MSSYATLAEFKAYLKIPTATVSEDTLLQLFLNEATALVDEIVGMPCAAAADSTRRYTDPTLVDGRTLVFGRGDVVANVTTITNGDGTALAATNYTLVPQGQPPYHGAELVEGATWVTTGAGVVIVGKWANTTNTNGTADPLIVGATLQLATWLYRSKDNVAELSRPVQTADGTTILPMALPRAVVDRLTMRRALP